MSDNGDSPVNHSLDKRCLTVQVSCKGRPTFITNFGKIRVF